MTDKISNVGVVGAGQMGCGIAQVSAAAGYKVTIYDLSKERIEAGLATINGNLARQVTNGKITDEQRKEALALISGSSDVNDLAAADLVIEAACNGLGVAVADRSMVAPLMQTGALTQVLDVEVEGHESYWLVTRTDRSLSPHVEALRRWLSHEIGTGSMPALRQANA